MPGCFEFDVVSSDETVSAGEAVEAQQLDGADHDLMRLFDDLIPSFMSGQEGTDEWSSVFPSGAIDFSHAGFFPNEPFDLDEWLAGIPSSDSSPASGPESNFDEKTDDLNSTNWMHYDEAYDISAFSDGTLPALTADESDSDRSTIQSWGDIDMDGHQELLSDSSFCSSQIQSPAVFDPFDNDVDDLPPYLTDKSTSKIPMSIAQPALELSAPLPRPGVLRLIRSRKPPIRKRATAAKPTVEPIVPQLPSDLKDAYERHPIIQPEHPRSKQADPNPRYPPIPDCEAAKTPPTPWSCFKYNSHGELDPAQEYTPAEIERYLFQHPLHTSTQNPRASPLKLRIGRCPAWHGQRFPTTTSHECRFSNCPTGTIDKGSYQVAFSETLHDDTNSTDPFVVAGYVHLWCLEQHLDLLTIIKELDIECDTRLLEHEGKVAYPMRCAWTHEKKAALAARARGLEIVSAEEQAVSDFFELVRAGTLTDYPDPKQEHEGTLVWRMATARLESEPHAIRAARERKAHGQGYSLLNHMGDLGLENRLKRRSRISGRKRKFEDGEDVSFSESYQRSSSEWEDVVSEASATTAFADQLPMLLEPPRKRQACMPRHETAQSMSQAATPLWPLDSQSLLDTGSAAEMFSSDSFGLQFNEQTWGDLGDELFNM